MLSCRRRSSTPRRTANALWITVFTLFLMNSVGFSMSCKRRRFDVLPQVSSLLLLEAPSDDNAHSAISGISLFCPLRLPSRRRLLFPFDVAASVLLPLSIGRHRRCPANSVSSQMMKLT
ncbi:uncharacterized protein LOC111798288 [Cucurbita pepo subsp. pepo]|uniref:uncharacterized protein LOC111798288 n=1 Tax=Cucurbita pepo subsp. pepo TaxID=3664 RepID=UPI000C9D7CAF|nr:uncharacterized protein LOC111798288 [Cucurbita pepo subsp. pepo]